MWLAIDAKTVVVLAPGSGGGGGILGVLPGNGGAVGVGAGVPFPGVGAGVDGFVFTGFGLV